MRQPSNAQCRLLTTMGKKPFGNIVRKEENVGAVYRISPFPSIFFLSLLEASVILYQTTPDFTDPEGKAFEKIMAKGEKCW